MQEEGADDGGNKPEQRQSVKTTGETTSCILHETDVPGAEEAAEIAD